MNPPESFTHFSGYDSAIKKRVFDWQEKDFLRRFWEKDPTLWFPEEQTEIVDRMGWLELPESMRNKIDVLIDFAREVKAEGTRNVVLLGMGGSSLAPEVFQKTFGNSLGYPELVVLDSTHPGAVKAVEQRLDLRETLFLVSSKSGTTLETLSLFRYFWKRMGEVTGRPGRHFAAITDPGTPLENLAAERGFRAVFQAKSDVGGRFSALTQFGLVPAALIGVDIGKLLNRARKAAHECRASADIARSAGFLLGAALGEMSEGRDKLTVITSSSLAAFPDWLEQLIAESLGKEGKGLVPVVHEPVPATGDYGQDRLFIGFVLENRDDLQLEQRMESLRSLGHPVILIRISDIYDLGAEIFEWEVATASAGAVMGVHPFNQPDVQLAKDLAKKAMQNNPEEEKGESPIKTVDGSDGAELAKSLRRWFGRMSPGDYIGIQAYLAPDTEVTQALQRLRSALVRKTRLAATLGFGPRFLHSTGQLHKGGKNTGNFIQLVDEPGEDLLVPETDFTFDSLIRAQALGDMKALVRRGRRVVRVRLGDAVSDLRAVEELVAGL